MAGLHGKVVIVTGGSYGIGREQAKFFASQGASVVVSGRGVTGGTATQSAAEQVVEEIRAQGGKAVAHLGDVANWENAEALVKAAIQNFGRLDVLLCNAGFVRDGMLHKISQSDWDDVIAVHLKGHFAPTHFASRYWREEYAKTKQPVNGRIIFTTSEAGIYGHLGQSNYSAAKAGIVGLCYCASKELERIGVTVNTISPRGRSGMVGDAFGEFDSVNADGFDTWDPANVPPFAGFLAGDAAANITGQLFVVYGGTVQRIAAPSIAAEISRDRRWTMEELMTESEKLIPGLAAKSPTFPDVGLPK